MSHTVAIMQPTFLPWLGYFAMIDVVDQFVFLDSVQFAKRSWQQRNRIKTNNGELLISVPVLSKGQSDQLIKDTKINIDEDFSRKFLNTLATNYSKTPFYKTYISEVTQILEENKESLCELNIELIKFGMKVLEIPQTKLLRSSQMDVDGKKAELLANISEKLKATIYLSAPGSKEYIDESDIFQKKNIEVMYHHYRHPIYPQAFGEFLPYMCTLDLIFNCGPESRSVMLKGLEKDVL
jgi:hypothetical protein